MKIKLEEGTLFLILACVVFWVVVIVLKGLGNGF